MVFVLWWIHMDKVKNTNIQLLVVVTYTNTQQFLIIFSPVFITHPFFYLFIIIITPLQTRYFLFYVMCCHNFDHLDFWGGSAWVVKSLGYPRGGKLTQNKFKNLPHLQLETSEAVFFSGWKWRKNVLNWSKLVKNGQTLRFSFTSRNRDFSIINSFKTVEALRFSENSYKIWF